jgi:uncharacterized protein with HEPN domain
MTETNPKSDKALVLYVLEQIEVIRQYLEGISDYEFYQNRMLKDACYARIMVIGEYSKRISGKIQEQHNYIEWEVMKRARNFYAHGYGSLDWTRVWETLQTEMPRLKIDFERLLKEL